MGMFGEIYDIIIAKELHLILINLIGSDNKYVIDFCKKNILPLYKYRVNVNSLIGAMITRESYNKILDFFDKPNINSLN